MIDTSWASTKAQAEQQRIIHHRRSNAEIERIIKNVNLAGFDLDGLNRLEYVRQLALSGRIEG